MREYTVGGCPPLTVMRAQGPRGFGATRQRKKEIVLQENAQTEAVKAVYEIVLQMHSETCSTISIVDLSNFSLTPEEILEKSNIDFDRVLKFTDSSIAGLTELGYTVERAQGLTLHFVKDDVPQSAIFLGSAPAGIREEDNSALFWTLQTIFLHHELMHAKDLQIGKNFNIASLTTDLVKAEVYADVKTLRFFDDMSQAGGDFFRNIYAAGILGRQKTPIYTRIFNGIKKTFPESRLRAWASNSALPPAE